MKEIFVKTVNKIKIYAQIFMCHCFVFINIEAMESSTFLRLDSQCNFTTQEYVAAKKVQWAEFSLIDGEKITSTCRFIADPAYDQTFKRIFDWDIVMDGFSGKCRILSLLNSIFFPNASANGYKIREITPLPNESTRLGERTPLGVLKFDIACRCSCWTENSQHDVSIFDIEMQTGYEEGFVGRLFDYGNTLRRDNDHKPVIVLAFLNYARNKDDNCTTRLFFVDNDGNPIKAVEGVVDTYCIDLAYRIKELMEGKSIVVNKNSLGKTGREWIKLLGLRHWAHEGTRGRYVLPQDLGNIDPVIMSALSILESVNESELQRYVDQESSAVAMLNGAKNAGIQQGIQRGRDEEAIKTAIRMINSGESLARIQRYTNLSVERIRALRKSIEGDKIRIRKKRREVQHSNVYKKGRSFK